MLATEAVEGGLGGEEAPRGHAVDVGVALLGLGRVALEQVGEGGVVHRVRPVGREAVGTVEQLDCMGVVAS